MRIHSVTASKFTVTSPSIRYFSSTLKYTKNHEWIEDRQQGEDLKIGITKFAKKELGDITYIEVDNITMGDVYEKGQNLCNIESVKSTSDIMMPISGEIVEINTELTDNPSIISEEKDEDGWIVKCKPNNLADFNQLMSEEEYNEYTQTHT
jgi:glycine cleavage system H protein